MTALHPLHICGTCAIGLMTVLAIAATSSHWTSGSATFLGGSQVTNKAGLWGYSVAYPGGSDSGQWSDTLDNDKPYCSDMYGPTNRDVLSKYRTAQAGAVLSIFSSIAFGIFAIIYSLGKITKKWLLVIPAGVTWVFALMAYGGYTSAYDTCDSNSCEQFVTGMMANGAIEASCGPAAGVWLVWAAQAVGVGAFVCLLIGRPPALAATATANANAQPINAVPYQAFPAQQQVPVGVVYQTQPHPGQQQQQAYPVQQQQQQHQAYPVQQQQQQQAYPVQQQQQQQVYPGQQDLHMYPGQQPQGQCSA